MNGPVRRGQGQDEAEIRQLMNEQAMAIRAKDARRLFSGYAPDIVKYDLAPPLRRTGPEVHDVDRLERWFAGFDDPIDWELRDLSVTVGEDVAFCHGLNRLSATPRGVVRGPDGLEYEGERFDLWFRITVGLRKIDGRWQITHEHTSTPFYMDGSFKAATDLRP